MAQPSRVRQGAGVGAGGMPPPPLLPLRLCCFASGSSPHVFLWPPAMAVSAATAAAWHASMRLSPPACKHCRCRPATRSSCGASGRASRATCCASTCGRTPATESLSALSTNIMMPGGCLQPPSSGRWQKQAAGAALGKHASFWTPWRRFPSVSNLTGLPGRGAVVFLVLIPVFMCCLCSGQWYRAYGNENWEFAPNVSCKLVGGSSVCAVDHLQAAPQSQAACKACFPPCPAGQSTARAPVQSIAN